MSRPTDQLVQNALANVLACLADLEQDQARRVLRSATVYYQDRSGRNPGPMPATVFGHDGKPQGYVSPAAACPRCGAGPDEPCCGGA